MFSKETSRQLRQEFWIAFGKSFPRKWILYNTKIKELSFKFHFDTKKALVSLDLPRVFLIEGITVNNRVNMPPTHIAVKRLWRKVTMVCVITGDRAIFFISDVVIKSLYNQ